MESVYVSKLKPLLDALRQKMDVYVPAKAGDHFTFTAYNPDMAEIEFNPIRVCTPVKEFLFPMRELAAVFPEPAEPQQITPFAVFGLKQCDVKSLEILDKVFTEEEFEDALYIKRRENMFVITSDCFDPADSCFCGVFEGTGHVDAGFDLNISKIKEGYIVDIGSQKAKDFINDHSKLIAHVPSGLMTEREELRKQVETTLKAKSDELGLDNTLEDIVVGTQDSDLFDETAETCIECQACTRVCPTCHCFFLYDSKQSDYFTKMKMWDSCMRMAYARVAGGENPRKAIGERIRHRLLHKFVYFLERYGINMCVGCGRCVDADAGGMDLRQMLGKLNQELKNKSTKVSK